MPFTPLARARRDQILAIIRQDGFARVSDLSERFAISEVTVRADLDALAASASVQRVHGGAIVESGARGLERAFEESQLDASDEKRRIALVAASLVRSGQTVVLDVGTTTTAVARAMLAREQLRDVVVVTNALNIAMALEPAIPRFTVIVTGGTLRPLQHSLVDPLAGTVFDQVRADIAFIGCSGVDASAGVTNVNLPEADAKRRMIEAAARTIVVADSTKVGVVYHSRVADWSEVDQLITGVEADIGPLTAVGVRVTLSP